MTNWKERPRCREVIVRNEMFPAERSEQQDGTTGARPLEPGETWSRKVAVTPDGEVRLLSGSLTKQMSKMIDEDYFSTPTDRKQQ